MAQIPDPFVRGALRSRLVSKLTGLSPNQLQHWHVTDLQTASRVPGERGVPRLYSWVDYQRLCVMAALGRAGVPTARIRKAVWFLDDVFPDWWRLSLRAYHGPVPGSSAKVHIVVRQHLDIVVDVPGGHMSFRDALLDDAPAVGDAVADALVELQRRGPLFLKNEFNDAVSMRPEVNAAQPTVKNTSLETAFVAAYAQRTSPSEVARIYRLEEWMVRRAVAFEAAA